MQLVGIRIRPIRAAPRAHCGREGLAGAAFCEPRHGRPMLRPKRACDRERRAGVPRALAMRALTGDKREAANFMIGTLTGISLGLGKVKLNVTGEEHSGRRARRFHLEPPQHLRRADRRPPRATRLRAVAKKELERVPLFAAASRFMHIAFLDRSDSKAAVAALEPARGCWRGDFHAGGPEGTRVAARASASSRRAHSAWRWPRKCRSCDRHTKCG